MVLSYTKFKNHKLHNSWFAKVQDGKWSFIKKKKNYGICQVSAETVKQFSISEEILH